MYLRAGIKFQTENDTDFVPRAVHVGRMVDRVVLGKVLLRVRRFYPTVIFPLPNYIHSCKICGLDNSPVSTRTSIDTHSHPLVTVTLLLAHL